MLFLNIYGQKKYLLIFDDNIKDFIQSEFSPEYNSRCQLDINYNPQAKCPRFINELIWPMLRDKMLLK